MKKIINNFFQFIFFVLLASFYFNSSHAYSVKKNEKTYKILSDTDIKLYSEIFNLQKKND